MARTVRHAGAASGGSEFRISPGRVTRRGHRSARAAWAPQRHGHDGLGPLRHLVERDVGDDAPAFHVQQQQRLGPLPGLRIAFGAVVVDAQARQMRQQPDQVGAAALVALADLRFGNVMTASGHPRPDALQVQLRR